MCKKSLTYNFYSLIIIYLTLNYFSLDPLKADSGLGGVQFIYPSQIEEIKILGPSDSIEEIIVGYSKDGFQFVKELNRTLDQIMNSKKREGLCVEKEEKRISLKPILLTCNYSNDFPKVKIREDEPLNNYFTVSSNDPWMRDVFTEVLIKLNKGDGKFHHAILDTNRGRETSHLPKILAQAWGIEYVIKIFNEAENSGDMGGNFAVTPKDILYYGNTMSEQMSEFFERKGYKIKRVILDSYWLDVGHVDEIVTTVPNSTKPCGMSILKADPLLAISLLLKSDKPEELNLSIDIPFEEKSVKFSKFHRFLLKYKDKIVDSHTGEMVKDLKIEIDKDSEEELTNYQFLLSQQEASIIINHNIERLKSVHKKMDKSCDPLHVMPVPTLFDCKYSIFKVPLQTHMISDCKSLIPNSTNMTAVGGRDLILPDPLYKPFQESIRATLMSEGFNPHFIEDLHLHNAGGEIHCGTNIHYSKVK